MLHILRCFYVKCISIYKYQSLIPLLLTPIFVSYVGLGGKAGFVWRTHRCSSFLLAHGTSSPILSLLVRASLHAKRISCTQRIKQPPLTCGDKFHDPEWALLTTDSTGPSSPRAALHTWPQRLRRQTPRLQRRVSARLLPVSPCSEVSVPPGSQRLLPFPGQGIVTPLFLQTRSLAFPFLFSFCYRRLEEGKQTPRGGHVYEATHGDLGRTVLTPAFVTAEPCFFLMEKS